MTAARGRMRTCDEATLRTYLGEIERAYRAGNATEHVDETIADHGGWPIA